MLKITGLDKLSRDIEDAQKAMSEIDGELGSVHFDPHDPGSIDQAIQEVERLIDGRIGKYSTNPIVGPLIQSMKDAYRQGIIDKAAATRMGEEDSSGE